MQHKGLAKMDAVELDVLGASSLSQAKSLL